MFNFPTVYSTLIRTDLVTLLEFDTMARFKLHKFMDEQN